MEKTLTEAFKDVKIPEGLEGIKVLSLTVDTEKRGVTLMIKPDSLPCYAEIERLKNVLIKNYVLNEICIKTTCEKEVIAQNFDVFKDYIIGEIADFSPVCKYIFEGSVWEYSTEKLKITLKHGCMPIIKDEKVTEKIKTILARCSFGGEIEIDEQFEKIEIETPKAEYVPRQAPVSAPLKSEAPVEVSEYILGKQITDLPKDIGLVEESDGKATIKGDIFFIDARELRNGKFLVIFYVNDHSGSMICKFFVTAEKYELIKGDLKKGMHVLVRGQVQYDNFEQDITLTARDINKADKAKKKDEAEVKRVELHAHTQMSTMDAIASAKSLVKLAKQYGHKAVAITDHGVVQAFPEAFHEKDDTIKILYGTEGYIVNDCDNLIYKGENKQLTDEVVVFDIETTGLSAQSEKITEIGAVLIKDGKICDTFETFVNPEKPIPAKIVELTGITDDMVKDAPSQNDAVDAFMAFVGGRPLIAHNADFDTGFIRENLSGRVENSTLDYLDTLALCRALVKEKKQHKLNIMAEHFGIENPSHHRAVNDAQVCAEIYLKCLELLPEEVVDFDTLNAHLAGEADLSGLKSSHIILFAKNLVGLKNLYKLISLSHLKYYRRTPRMPKSEILKHRDGLLIGSACEAGELFKAIKDKKSDEEIKKLCEFYDYFEVQPIGNNMFMLREGIVSSVAELQEFNKKIIELGEKYGKPVVATGDVHFLNPEDEVYRRILMAAKKFDDADNQAPLYFRTTDEMLKEFDYLGEEKAREIVIENTNKIADMIEDIRPVPKEKCPPVIEGSDKDIERMCREKATRIYGDDLPEIVETRMKKELTSIINNGFAVMYMIAHKLVKKSLEDGYLVGSRGSVGSSFVAFLTDITEVNSLPPHYVCPKCKYSEFLDDAPVSSGCDLPDKVCPKCGAQLYKDGHDIPFETFLGFNGDKAPDIDLNFSGDYQSTAHKYTEVLFGEGYVFRAGTIGTVAEKTAFGYVKNYFDERGLASRKADVAHIVEGCTGVKRTTGQHPGGVIVLPKGHDIHEFTPVQHPADKSDVDIITTHFDYHSIDENLLKLDLLGHDDPTVIRMLEDITGLDAKKIPLDDQDTMSIFTSTEILGVTQEDINSEVGTYAVPEFGTKFVRQMLVDTKPKTFSDLIRISGLSHGTDVWTNNAQDLVTSGTCTLSSCICTRDDIMIYLIKMGLDPSMAFKIMESVRKGKGLNDQWEAAMRENNVPEWYIDSCKKIKYMFPKAHACAYVTMAFRIAYFKVHYPLAFYMAYFSVRADGFEYDIMCHGADKVKEAIKNINAKGNDATPKEKAMIPVLEVCIEMYARGIEFLPMDLYKSHSDKFLEEGGRIRPPLNSLPGVGTAAAKNIVLAREKGEFIAIDDMVNRSGITKAVVEALQGVGCLDGMTETSQLTFFV